MNKIKSNNFQTLPQSQNYNRNNKLNLRLNKKTFHNKTINRKIKVRGFLLAQQLKKQLKKNISITARFKDQVLKEEL